MIVQIGILTIAFVISVVGLMRQSVLTWRG